MSKSLAEHIREVMTTANDPREMFRAFVLAELSVVLDAGVDVDIARELARCRWHLDLIESRLRETARPADVPGQMTIEQAMDQGRPCRPRRRAVGE